MNNYILERIVKTYALECLKVKHFSPKASHYTHTDTLIFSFTATSYSEAVVIGYNELNFTLASVVRNCQLTLAASVLRSTSHTTNSSRRFVILSILRDKHCLVITLSSISAMSSQLPCLGV